MSLFDLFPYSTRAGLHDQQNMAGMLVWLLDFFDSLWGKPGARYKDTQTAPLSDPHRKEQIFQH